MRTASSFWFPEAFWASFYLRLFSKLRNRKTKEQSVYLY